MTIIRRTDAAAAAAAAHAVEANRRAVENVRSMSDFEILQLVSAVRQSSHSSRSILLQRIEQGPPRQDAPAPLTREQQSLIEDVLSTLDV